MQAMVFRGMGILERGLANIDVVYHGSSRTGTSQLDPRVSTHGIAYVYAIRSIAQAVAFP